MSKSVKVDRQKSACQFVSLNRENRLKINIEVIEVNRGQSTTMSKLHVSAANSSHAHYHGYQGCISDSILYLVPKEDLKSMFGSCGKVDDVYKGFDHHHHRPYAVVTMADKAGSEKAIAELNYNDLTRRRYMAGMGFYWESAKTWPLAVNVAMLKQTKNEGNPEPLP